jgi:hypothetical protein
MVEGIPIGRLYYLSSSFIYYYFTPLDLIIFIRAVSKDLARWFFKFALKGTPSEYLVR